NRQTAAASGQHRAPAARLVAGRPVLRRLGATVVGTRGRDRTATRRFRHGDSRAGAVASEVSAIQQCPPRATHDRRYREPGVLLVSHLTPRTLTPRTERGCTRTSTPSMGGRSMRRGNGYGADSHTRYRATMTDLCGEKKGDPRYVVYIIIHMGGFAGPVTNTAGPAGTDRVRGRPRREWWQILPLLGGHDTSAARKAVVPALACHGVVVDSDCDHDHRDQPTDTAEESTDHRNDDQNAGSEPDVAFQRLQQRGMTTTRTVHPKAQRHLAEGLPTARFHKREIPEVDRDRDDGRDERGQPCRTRGLPGRDDPTGLDQRTDDERDDAVDNSDQDSVDQPCDETFPQITGMTRPGRRLMRPRRTGLRALALVGRLVRPVRSGSLLSHDALLSFRLIVNQRHRTPLRVMTLPDRPSGDTESGCQPPTGRNS